MTYCATTLFATEPSHELFASTIVGLLAALAALIATAIAATAMTPAAAMRRTHLPSFIAKLPPGRVSRRCRPRRTGLAEPVEDDPHEHHREAGRRAETDLGAGEARDDVETQPSRAHEPCDDHLGHDEEDRLVH